MTIIEYINFGIALLLLGTALFLTLWLRFPQCRLFGTFIHILRSKESFVSTEETLSPVKALLTAMSTSIGMGTIVAPSIAIVLGGPGALFWMIVYAFFGCVTKYTEVVFAVLYKRRTAEGVIIGGPASYLHTVHPWLGDWYAACTIFLFGAWTALQSKSMAATYAHLAIPEHVTGSIVAAITLFVLVGGIKRIGNVSAALIPVMCALYLGAASLLLCADLTILWEAFRSIFLYAFVPMAPVGGFLGSTVLGSIRQGVFKAAYVTEAGVGTAAIPHALADTTKPTHQGVLAMFSMIGDIFFCTISGLVVLVTGVWRFGIVTNDLPMIAFKSAFPLFGVALYTSIVTLFVMGTVIGNSLNGSKSFAYFSHNRWMKCYYAYVCCMIFFGAIFDAPTLWSLTDVVMPLVVGPHVIGLLILALRHRALLMKV